MRIKFSTIIMACLITFLTACTKDAPKCSDDGTLSLVRKIILDKIGSIEGFTEKEIQDNMKIELPRASAFDEKIKKYSCEATVNAGDVYQLPINYESQLDDKNQQIVSVHGIAIRDLNGVAYGIIEGIKKSRAEKGVNPKSSEAPSAPKPTEQANTTPAIAPKESGENIPTRFGMLRINEEKMLLYKNSPLTPGIQGNNSLSKVGTYQLGESDVVLVQDNGGTGCPAQLYFVAVSVSGVKATSAFGTCTDLIDVKQTADTISVTMPGFMGSSESEKAQKKAAKEKHIYVFKGGVLTENGMLVK
jgi:hypothetical protein